MKVEINGIEYVPASKAVANYEQIARAIIAGYNNNPDDKAYRDALSSDPGIGLFVLVDDTDDGDLLVDVMARVAKSM